MNDLQDRKAETDFMKTVGIIAEYNPFHSGHQYHIEMAKKITGADFCVAVMSGDFVQRGEPAIFSKYLRTRMALSCGADLVIELPSLFASASAEDFASCGVALLSSLGAVDFLCFGSEAGEIVPIRQVASLLSGETPEFSAALKEGLRRGLTWPQARKEAFASAAVSHLTDNEASDLLNTPNNLLGIEYCKAILRQKSSLEPVTIRREGRGYHDGDLTGAQASASALRTRLHQQAPDLTPLLPHIPPAIHSLYSQGLPISPEDCSALLNFTLLTMQKQGQDFSLYGDMSQALSDRLNSLLLSYEGWEGRIRQLKTRQYTYTRISRCLLQLMLGITKAQLEEAREAGFAPYARILGFRSEAGPLLTRLKKSSAVPLITKTAGAHTLLTKTALSMFQQDIYASHVRQSLEAAKYGTAPKNEYNQPICILRTT